MAKNNHKYQTIRELIYWFYSNLAMAHEAITKGKEKYDRTSFIIRSRLFSGLKKGTMTFGSIIDDEKVKIQYSDICAYCGKSDNVSIDHIIPKLKGGKESADNLIRVCSHCNSSKGAKDMMTWHLEHDEFPSILIMRRYIKLIFQYCSENNLLDIDLNEIDSLTLPFDIKHIVTEFPAPNRLQLYK